MDATTTAVTTAHGAAALTPHQTALSESVVYLMGMSFILGSLFAIFILVLLDFMKRRREQ